MDAEQDLEIETYGNKFARVEVFWVSKLSVSIPWGRDFILFFLMSQMHGYLEAFKDFHKFDNITKK